MPIKKTISIQSSTVIQADSRVGSASTPAVVDVNHEDSDNSYAIIEFVLSSNLRSFFFDSTVTVTKVELIYWYALADTPNIIDSIDFVNVDTVAKPSSTSLSTLLTKMSSASSVESQSVSGDEKTKTSIELDMVSAIQTVIEETDAVETWIAVGIRKTDSSTNGFVQIGGETLIEGSGEDWVAADSGEITAPPELLITYELDEANHVVFGMNYTTSDPMTNQSTPSNSIGGYNKNVVYTTDEISDYVSSSQTTIPIAGSLSDITNGLLQIGPEIVQYTGTDTDSNELTGIIRGIVPLSGSPSTTELFPETVEYLNISQLFDTSPTDDLVKYRCVAIQNTSTLTAKEINLSIVQNPDSPVQLDMAIELPIFQTHTGTQTGDTGNFIEDNTSFIGSGVIDGQYEDAAIIIDEDTSRIGIVDRFEVAGDVITIVFTDDNLTISNGETYRIIPAMSQRLNNEVTAPINTNSFNGFISDGALVEADIKQYDLFYLWLKLIYTDNSATDDDIGAIIMLDFKL